MKNRIASLFVLLFLSSLIGCGPKVALSPDWEKANPHVLALLPATAPETVRQERVHYIQNAVANQLRNSGYYLLDEGIVSRICSEPGCPKRVILADKYGVDGFAEVSVESNSRNNFGVGFYNEVTAQLQIKNKSNETIATISHTQSKRGGLVFQSGQVIEGIKEQYSNFGDDGFNLLADKFAETAVSKLPLQRSAEDGPSASDERVTTTISQVSATSVQQGVYEVCVEGTANAIASIVVRRINSNLREIRRGYYCGIYSADAGVSSDEELNIELRSVLGNPVRRSVSLRTASIASTESLKNVAASKASAGRKRAKKDAI